MINTILNFIFVIALIVLFITLVLYIYALIKRTTAYKALEKANKSLELAKREESDLLKIEKI